MYCLDTNIIIDFFRGDKGIINNLTRLSNKGANFFITYLTLCELYKGAFLHLKKEEKVIEIDNFASDQFILDFNINSCRIYGSLYYLLSKSGKMIPEPDIMIASIVKANNFILITRDKRHFENLGIKVEKW